MSGHDAKTSATPTAKAAAPESKGKMDRFLAAVSLGGKSKPDKKDAKDKKDASLSQPEMQISRPIMAASDGVRKTGRSFKTADFAPKISANLTRIKLTGPLLIEVRMEFAGEAYKQNEKNDLFVDDLLKIANNILVGKIDKYVDDMTKHLAMLDTDTTVALPPPQVIQKGFEAFCMAAGKQLSAEMQNLVTRYVESNKAIKAAYRSYQVKCVSQIVTGFTVIVGGIAATAASFGATGPVAIVAIFRTAVGLGQAVWEMTKDADTVMRDIEDTFIALDKMYVKIDDLREKAKAEDEEDKKNNKPKDPNKDKERQKKEDHAYYLNSAVEAGVGVLAGLLNFDFPSVETLKKKLDTFDNKLNGIHVERLSLGETAKEAQSEIERYRAKIKKEKNETNVDKQKIARAEKQIANFEQAQVDLKKHAETMFTDIVKALARKKEFEDNLETYKKSMMKYSGKTRMVVGFATAIGLGVGSGAGSVEQGLNGLNECLGFAKEQLEEHLL